MQTNTRLFDDLARLATGALGTAQGVKTEWENLFSQRLERYLSEKGLVSREEFDAVKAMAILLREENEELRSRIEALEKASKAQSKKPAARKSTAKTAKKATDSGA